MNTADSSGHRKEEEEFSSETLLDFFEGKTDSETTKRIQALREDPSSKVHEWFERLFWKARNFEKVDWNAMFQESLEMEDDEDGSDE